MFLRTLLLIIVSLATHVAAAQESTTANSAALNEARTHFERGVELYREGSYNAALAEFERSNQLVPNYKLLYNLAQVQAERHEYVAAVKLLNEYLQTGGSAIAAERRQAVMQDLEKLRQRIAALSVDVSVDGVEVFVNDVSIGRSPLSEPVLVNVGTCRVRTEKAGFTPQSQTLTVAGADRLHVSFTLVAERAVVQQPLAAKTIIVKTEDTTPFWISLGGAIVLGGATGVFGGLTLGANHDLDQALNRFPTQQHTVDSARSKLRVMAGLTDGFGAATILAAGTAIYFLLSPPEHTEVVPAASPQARITPTPTGASLSVVF
jgi:tetratricopeptide (TPR) repeat protein